MKKITMVLIISAVLFGSCTDNKKAIVDTYLLHLNNHEIEKLSSLLDENFSINFLGEESNKETFLS